jgi:serine/threonine protein kinase/tetratricopeptide (TPR) repeat protein
MKCPKCNSDNPDTKQFCGDCGTQLSQDIPEVTKTLETPAQDLTRGAKFAGRYEIVEKLGTGGMGSVYRVEDTKIHEDVALKLIKPDIAADKKTIERFSNELKLARKIRHKNVCQMFDLGEAEGIHFITMEYVSGEDLKSLIRRVKQIPIGTAISIVKQLCDGLYEAHQLGVVHRDLKPSNIMIDKDGNARIMDFGIARSMKGKDLTGTGDLIGTPQYMSPEQVEGEEVDQRSDIYSLGVIFFEMLTGRAPFIGDTAMSVALKHKTEDPPNPREFSDHISAELNDLILKCMKKERDERFQRLEDVRVELKKIEKEMSTVAEPPEYPQPAFLLEPDGKEFVEERPIFVARENEIKKLNKFLDNVLSGRGQVALVTGEAGDGKTYLVEEFARIAQEAHSDLIVVNGKCNAHTGIGEPYLPFREVLSLLTGDVEAKWEAGAIIREYAIRLWNLLPFSVKALMDSGSDLIGTFVSGEALSSRAAAFTPTLSDLVGRLEKVIERKMSATPDPNLQQIVLFNQYTSVLQTLARQYPLLLILDDLQWADAGSISLLFHLGKRIERNRIFIVGNFRSAEVALGRGGERHPLAQVINEFKRDYGDIEIEVGKGEEREFIDALIDQIPNKLGVDFRDTFFRQTKGHPLFTVELLNGMQEQDVLLKDEDGYWIEGPQLNWGKLPVRVEAVIEERISRLKERLREVLTLASVEGEEFTAEVIANLQQTDVRGLVQLLSSELDKKHHLVSTKGIQRINNQRLSQYLFRHILFQKYLYNGLDEVERTHLHEDVGNVLEVLYGEQTEEIAGQLARHFQKAGLEEKALKYLKMAGDRAKNLHANREALDYYARALEVSQKIGDSALMASIEVARNRGFVNISIGDFTGAVIDFDFMLKSARRLKDRHLEGIALGFLGMAEGLNHEFEAAENTARKALVIAKEGFDDVLLLASCWLWMFLIDLGRLTESEVFYQMALNAEPKVKDRFVRMGPIFLGFRDLYRGDFDKTLEFISHTRTDAEKCGVFTFFLAHRWIETMARMGKGEYEKSLRLLEDILDTCEQTDEVYTKVRVLNTIGWIYSELQDHLKALEWNTRGLKETQEANFPDQECEGNVRLNLGDNLMALGRIEEAEEQFLWVEQVVKNPQPQDVFMLWKYSQHFYHSYGELWLYRGNYEKAISYADKCLEIAEVRDFESKKNIVKGRRLRGQVLMGQGKLEEAEQEISVALKVAHQVGNPTQLWLTYTTIGDLWQLQGRPEDSMKAYRDAYSVIEDVANNLSDESRRELFLNSKQVQGIKKKLEN